MSTYGDYGSYGSYGSTGLDSLFGAAIGLLIFALIILLAFSLKWFSIDEKFITPLNLAIKVLGDDDIMYCPHGRPVAFEIKKYNLEKYFGRIQ